MRGDYLAKLSQAARWYLPQAEAAEGVEDYRDLIQQEPRSEEELLRDLGSPWSAARQLIQPRAYRRWVAVFAVLAVCLLPPSALPLLKELSEHVLFQFPAADWPWRIISLCGKIVPFLGVFLLTGAALSLVWFRRRSGEERHQPLPRGVAPLLLLLLIGLAFEWGVIWISLELILESQNALAKIWGWMTSDIAAAMRLAMVLTLFVMGIIGMLALVRARMTNRRWRAVYVLALAGSILGMSVFALWTSMDVSFSGAGWQTPILLRYVAITVVGLVGTGVSLC